MTLIVVYWPHAETNDHAMKSSRLITLVLLLQQRPASAAELAETLEVSTRTVLRDIDALSAAGVPVWAERGRDGGFRIDPEWGARISGLTEPEAQALMLGGVPSIARDFGLGAEVLNARLKLLANLPKDWRTQVERVSARLHVDPSDWYRAEDPAQFLHAVAGAVWRDRVIHVRYASWRGETERELAPFGLVLKAGAWYMVARAPAGGELRTYRLSNIKALRETGRGFARPDAFDLAGHWRASVERFERELLAVRAQLRVTALGLERLRNQRMHVTAPPGPPQTWMEVDVLLESIDMGARQLLTLGAEAQVIAPAALRARVLALLDELRAIYGAAA